MNLFEEQKVTIYANGINYDTNGPNRRQPKNTYSNVPFAEHVPCTIGGISNRQGNLLMLFISRKNVEKYLPSLPLRGYKIVVEHDPNDKYSNPVSYMLSKEPQWPNGIRHHIEATLEEYN